MRRPVAAVLLAVAAGAAGCGSSGERSLPQLTVALDFTPNAVHAPLYAAVREGLDRREGVRLRIRTPGASPDSLKTVLSGAADLGVLDIHDLGLAVEKGRDVVAVAALVERPLGALVALPPVRRPRDLEGRRVGVSGLPSDPAFVRAIVEHDGGDFSKVDLVTIGFAAVSALLSRRVAAVPAFWNAEGVALRRRGRDVNEFRIDDYGAPRYPEVVFVTTREELRTHRDMIERFLATVRDGMRATLARPAVAARLVARAANSPDVALVRAQLRAVSGALRPFLVLDRGTLRRWAAFDARIGLLPRAPDVARAFDFSVARARGR